MDRSAGAGPSWYDAGLRFECTGCGHCCTGSHGYVWVDEAEIHLLAAHLGLHVDEFGRRYLRRVGMRYALLESPGDGACVFLAGTACSVYAARPRQCRAFPFWATILETPRNWERAADECEGIRADARLWNRDEIDACRRG